MFYRVRCERAPVADDKVRSHGEISRMSPRQRVQRTRAVILRRRNYGEADRILTVYTPQLGKLQLIAKGIRKTSSRKAGHLELFTHTALLVAQARTWGIITEAETIESFRFMRQDLDSVGRTSYVSELIDSFTQADDENQPLWDLMLLVLRVIDQYAQAPAKSNPQVLLRWFELHLLNLVGFQPELFHCLNCGLPLQPVLNYLSLENGGILCPDCGPGPGDVEPIEPDVLKVLRHLQRTPWEQVADLVVRPSVMGRVENILYRYLIVLLEHQLKSTEFMRRLRANKQP